MDIHTDSGRRHYSYLSCHSSHTPHVEIAYRRANPTPYHYYHFRDSFVHLDPSLAPFLHVSTVNVRSLQVRAYSINSRLHFKEYTEFVSNSGQQFPTFLDEVWRQSFEVVPEKEDNNNLAWYLESRTTIDLTKAFGCDDTFTCSKAKESQVILVVCADDTVAPVDTFIGKKLWVNWSDIGLHCVADGDTIYMILIII